MKFALGRKWIGTVARLFGGIFGLTCLGVFAAPFVFAGILGIGNITGMAVSILLILYCVFAPFVHKVCIRLWHGKIGRVALLAITTVCILIASLTVVETTLMAWACVKPGTTNATAIVLGCRLYGERPSLSLVERLDAAYDYLTEHPDAVCVVSGGQGPGEDISEAEAMYRYLINKGIEPERIYKEDKSTSTKENLMFSEQVIEENKLFQKTVIISNNYHLYRAGMIADELGMVWGGEPAETAAWLFPTYYVRELYAILAEWILY